MPTDLNTLGKLVDIPKELIDKSAEIDQLVMSNLKLKRKLHTCYFIGGAVAIIAAIVFLNNKSFNNYGSIEDNDHSK